MDQIRRISDILNPSEVGNEVWIGGWVRTRRDSKAGFSFLEVNDGSCFANMQIVFDKNLPNFDSELKKLYTGASVMIRGLVKESPGQKQPVEIEAMAIDLIGEVDPATYPISKKKISHELLREVAHLRPRTNTFGAVTRIRNRLSMAVHEFFQERGFYYLQTPILSSNDAEGAGNIFHVTSLNFNDLPKKDGKVDYSRDFFGKPANLTVSGQLNAEAYACALGKVYTFGPTFRAENSNTSRHLAEFWMIEPEMAFCHLEQDVALAQDFLRHLLKEVLEKCPAEMEFFEQRVSKGIKELLEKIVVTPYEVVTYTDAIRLLEHSGEKFEFPVFWGCDLQSEHERYLCEKKFNAPVVVTDFPKDIKAFYMKLNNDGKTVRAMDVLVPGVGEIIGGSEREIREDILLQRMKELKIEPEGLEWYLDLRRFGTVPHAGFGLGFERMVQFCTGLGNIRDAIPFPRTPGNLQF